MEPTLLIGEVVRRSGVAASALRFYEGRGLIASERAGSGHRRYPRSVLRRIAFIVFAQRIGLTLEEIGAALARLPTDRIPTRGDWALLSGEWTKRIDRQIAELRRLRAGLTQCIGCGCLSIDRCRLANPADRAGRRGAGPALLARLKTPARKRRGPIGRYGRRRGSSPPQQQDWWKSNRGAPCASTQPRHEHAPPILLFPMPGHVPA